MSNLAYCQIMYKVQVHDQRFEYLVITFLFHLVGYIVFTNKNAAYVDVTFLEFFFAIFRHAIGMHEVHFPSLTYMMMMIVLCIIHTRWKVTWLSFWVTKVCILFIKICILLSNFNCIMIFQTYLCWSKGVR